jgi:hypothetical protein
MLNVIFYIPYAIYKSEQDNYLYQFLIVSDFIQGIGRCEPIVQKLEPAYEQVISSLTDKSLIPYYPNLYPIPFMIIKRYRVRFYPTRVLFYSLTYPDSKDFHKFGVYIYKGLIENFPNLLPGMIGHEIAHVIASKGRVELTKEDLALILKDRLGYINAKEKSAEDVYCCFAKEIQSKIKEWNIQSRLQEIEDSITKDAQLVNQECFDKLIFRHKLEDYKQFVKSNLNRISES